MHPKFQTKLLEDAIKKAADNNRAILDQMLSIMEDEELPEMESMIRWIVYNVNQLDDMQLAHIMLKVSTPKEEELASAEIEVEDDNVEDYPAVETDDEDEEAGNSFTLKLFHLDNFSNYEQADYHCYFKLSGELLDENIYGLHNYDNSELIADLVDSIDELYPYFTDLIHLSMPALEHLLERSTSDEIEGNPLEGSVRQFSFETDQAKYEVEIDLGFICNLQNIVDNGDEDEHAEIDWQ